MDQTFVRYQQYTILTLSSDAQNPRFVYEWRQEQERTLRAAKGTGMTEEQVNHFVDGCTYIFELLIPNILIVDA
jgi:D-glycerate 3-kinase